MAPDVTGWSIGDRVLADPIARFRRSEDPDPKMPIKVCARRRTADPPGNTPHTRIDEAAATERVGC